MTGAVSEAAAVVIGGVAPIGAGLVVGQVVRRDVGRERHASYAARLRLHVRKVGKPAHARVDTWHFKEKQIMRDLLLRAVLAPQNVAVGGDLRVVGMPGGIGMGVRAENFKRRSLVSAIRRSFS